MPTCGCCLAMGVYVYTFGLLGVAVSGSIQEWDGGRGRCRMKWSQLCLDSLCTLNWCTACGGGH